MQNIWTYDDRFVESGEDETANSFATIYLRMDAEYFEYKRDAYTFLEFLGDVGGLQSALILAGYIIVSFFTQRLYFSSIMKQLYQTKYERQRKNSSTPKPNNVKNTD